VGLGLVPIWKNILGFAAELWAGDAIVGWYRDGRNALDRRNVVRNANRVANGTLG